MTTTDEAKPSTSDSVAGAQALSRLLALSLKRKRVAEGRQWSQTRLSQDLRVTDQTVSRWFRGQTRPSDFNIERLRRLLDWSDLEYSGVTSAGERTPSRTVREDLPDAWERLSLPRDFPELPSLRGTVSRPELVDRGSHDLPLVDSMFVASKATAQILSRAADANSTRTVVTSLGHGATTLAQVLTDRRAAQTVPARAIVFTHSLTSMISPDPDTLLHDADAQLSRLHPSARDGRWNPDEEWIVAQGEEFAAEKFRAVTSGVVRDSLERCVLEAAVRSLICQPRVVGDLNHYVRLIGLDLSTPLDDPAIRRALRRHRVKLFCAAFDVPSRLGQGHLSRLELDPASLRVCSESPIVQWADIADLSPTLVPAAFSDLSSQLGSAEVRLHGVIDLSPSPVGRMYVKDKGGELLTQAYSEALVAYATELIALRERLGCCVDLTIIVPREALRLLPPTLSFDIEMVDSDGVREQLEISPYMTSDFLQMIQERYLSSDDPRSRRDDVLAELSTLVALDESIGLSTAAWLAKQRMMDLPVFTDSTSSSWKQEDFEEAVRGLSQMIGLPVSGDPSGRRAAELFLSGLQRELPRREDGAHE